MVWSRTLEGISLYPSAKIDRRTAYFLRGPVVPDRGNSSARLAPTVEEVFDVLKISFGSADPLVEKGASPNRSYAIRSALPGIYERPTREDLVQAKIPSVSDHEVRAAYYNFKRRKEISVYDEVDQTVVTVIFTTGEEPALVGSKGVRELEQAVVWVQIPQADFSAMTTLLSRVHKYVGRIE